LTSETYESISGHFGRTPWTGDRAIARPLPTQESTTHEKRGHTSTHTYFERGSNPRSQCSSGQSSYVP